MQASLSSHALKRLLKLSRVLQRLFFVTLPAFAPARVRRGQPPVRPPLSWTRPRTRARGQEGQALQSRKPCRLCTCSRGNIDFLFFYVLLLDVSILPRSAPGWVAQVLRTTTRLNKLGFVPLSPS